MYLKTSIKNPSNTAFTIAMAAMLLFAACSNPTAKTTATPPKIVKPVSYPTVGLQLINPEYTISAPGELQPYEQVALYARVTGFVKRLYADRGAQVKKGQLLAQLEAPEMNQKYLFDKSAEDKVYSDYLFEKQNYERLVEASATTGAVAAIELDRAKSVMESAQSAYQSSKASTAQAAQLQQYLRITAPFDGVITERNLSVGALAGTTSGQPIFTMAQGNRLRLTLSLPEKHAASVKEKMAVTFTTSAQPGKVFNAKLSRTSGLLNQQDRSLTLEFDVDNASGALQGGEYAQVQLKLQRNQPSYWVNKQSVLHTQSGTFLLALHHQEISRIPVKEGITIDTLTEVFGNIAPADQILKTPSEEISEGKINP
ncbi:MAG: efflux RND transporter periplasmic adaptor subunit [Sphingobacteriaceae bacterium]